MKRYVPIPLGISSVLKSPKDSVGTNRETRYDQQRSSSASRISNGFLGGHALTSYLVAVHSDTLGEHPSDSVEVIVKPEDNTPKGTNPNNSKLATVNGSPDQSRHLDV